LEYGALDHLLLKPDTPDDVKAEIEKVGKEARSLMEKEMESRRLAPLDLENEENKTLEENEKTLTDKQKE
jgi:hypothetical protein